MITLLLIALCIVVLFFVVTYFILQWHDRIKKETVERAIEGGCPFFTKSNYEDSE